MLAQFDTICPECDMRIYAGSSTIVQTRAGVWVHTKCPPIDPRYALQPGEVVCGECFLVKPCGCDS